MAFLQMYLCIVCVCVYVCACLQVFASAPTAHGLISEAFLGTAAPDPAAGALPGCDNLAAGLDMVARCADSGMAWGRRQC